MNRTLLVVCILMATGLPVIAQAPSKPKLSVFSKWTEEAAKDWGLDAAVWAGKAQDLVGLIDSESEDAVLGKRLASGTYVALGRCAHQEATSRLLQFMDAMDALEALTQFMIDAEESIKGVSPELGKALKKQAAEGMKIYNQAMYHRRALIQWADTVAGKADWK